jgi:hypothetical protein
MLRGSMTSNARPKTVYEPWKGPRYGAKSQFEMGILIVGESHYDYGDGCVDDAGLTRRVFSDENMNDPFRKQVAEAVLGTMVEDLKTYRDFWDSVAAYNYVRRLLSHPVGKAIEHATRIDLRDPEAAVAFTDEVLPSLRPDLILVFSRNVWNWLPDFSRTAPKIEGKIGREAGWYNCGRGHFALAVGFTHPSYWNRVGETAMIQHGFIARALAATGLPKRTK